MIYGHRSILIVTTICWCMWISVSAGQPLPPPPRLIVPADVPAPVIDGIITDDEWADAASFSGMHDGNTGFLTDKSFNGFIKSDGTYLYVAFRSKVPSTDKLLAEYSERDSLVPLDDSWELFFYNDLQSPDFFQVIVNSRDAIFDWYQKDIAWNGNWQIRQHIEQPDRWDAELAIPLADLGLPEEIDGRQCRFGLYVNQRAVEGRSFSWAPLIGLFEQPARMGIITFRNRAKVIGIESFGSPLSGEFSPVVRGASSQNPIEVVLTDAKSTRNRLVIDQPDDVVNFDPLSGSGQATLSMISPPGASPYAAAFFYATQIQYDSVPAQVRLTNFPSRQSATLELDYSALDSQERVRFYRIRTSDDVHTFERTSATSSEQVDVSTKGLPSGEAEWTVELLDGGGIPLLTKKVVYIKEGGEEWRANRVGIMPGCVPVPYTPVRIEGAEVEVIGRRLELLPTGLPRQVTSAGVELLRRPVSISGRIDDSPAILSADQPLVFTTIAADDSVAEASVRLGTLVGTLKQTISFDGLCWYDLQLSGIARAEGVCIEIPLATDAAQYYQLTDADWASLGLADWEVADLLRKDMSFSFMPQIYLGNDRAGIAWMAESQQGWQLSNDNLAIEVIRKDQEVLLRINLVDEPIDIDGFRISFGLQATPVKPVTAQQQRFIFAPGRMKEYPAEAKVYEVYQGHRAEDPGTFVSYAGLPEPQNPELARQAAAQYARRGSSLTPYSELTWLSLGLREMKVYGGDWSLNEPWAGTAGSAANTEPFGRVDIENPDYQDFIVWRFLKNWDAYGGGSLYIDLFSPIQNRYEPHGRAYITRSGRTAYPWPIRAMRTIARRLYIAYKEKNPEFAIFTHASSMYTALISMGDAWPVGEHFGLAASRYPEVLSYERYRAWFYGYPIGLKTMFLPSMKSPALTSRTELTNYLVGIVFNHNTTFWICFVNPWIAMPYMRTYHGGDWANQEYLPYWRNRHLTTLDPEKFKVSGWWNQKSKRGFLVIASQSPDPQVASIEPGSDWPYGSEAKLTDAVRNTIGFYEFGTWNPQAYFNDGTASFLPYGVLMLDVDVNPRNSQESGQVKQPVAED